MGMEKRMCRNKPGMANLLDTGGRVGEASATSAGEGNPFWRNEGSQKETSLEPSEFDFEYIDVLWTAGICISRETGNRLEDFGITYGRAVAEYPESDRLCLRMDAGELRSN